MDDIAVNAFTSNHQISTEQLSTVCKYRQGAVCCRYIYFSAQSFDFFCAKNIPELREKIDSIADEMAAQGDNCIGLS